MNKALRRLYTAAFLAALSVQPVLAQGVQGGIDPETGMKTLWQYLMVLGGITIPLICTFKGVHAVADGRSLMPYIGSAIGGMVLCFGGAYLTANYS